LRGSSTSIFLRLCSLAPRMMILSVILFIEENTKLASDYTEKSITDQVTS
jgi:hypothetical protein